MQFGKRFHFALKFLIALITTQLNAVNLSVSPSAAAQTAMAPANGNSVNLLFDSTDPNLRIKSVYISDSVSQCLEQSETNQSVEHCAWRNAKDTGPSTLEAIQEKGAH